MHDLIQTLKRALEEILLEATSDKDWEVVLTAACAALDAIEQSYEDPLPF